MGRVQNFAVIRTVRESDATALAVLRADSLGIEPTALISKFEIELMDRIGTSDWQMFVAELDGRIIGYSRCEKHISTSGRLYETVQPLPDGWYLRGIVVLRQYQRNGVASTLTSARLQWLDQRTRNIFCFLDSDEKVQLPLYLRLGFSEVSRNWKFQDPSRDDTGILLRR